MDTKNKPKFTIKRVGRYFYKAGPIFDSAGKAIHSVVTHIMVEFHP